MSKIIFYFRTFLYSITLLTVSFFAVGIGLVCTLLGNRLNTNYYVARTFWYTCGPVMGWKFEVEGEEYLWVNKGEDGAVEGDAEKRGRSAVMVGNHQSFVDILYLGRIFPKRAAIMAKKSLSRLPGLGWFMLLSGTVFINRSNNKSAVASMQQAGEDMKRKRISLWIFPEGTRHLSPKPDLLSFKKGAFYLAVQSGVPIIPVVCENYHHLFDGKTRFKAGTLKIKVLPPIPTTGLTTSDVPALMEKTRNIMVEALQSISQHSDSSTTPLLAQSRLSGEYQSTEISGSADETVVEAEVGEEEREDGIERSSSGMTGNGRPKPAKKIGKKGKMAVAMISDFFHPVAGGVEGHIYYLAVELISRGHKVIVITHHHPPRVGIRYLAPGLKIYHLPYPPISSGATLPNFLLFLPYFRSIILRENITLIHGHGSLSSLAHEAILHAPLLGVRTVFTDHSLFGFGDAVGILTNKLLVGALRNVDAVICVSNTGRENTVLRAQIEPGLVSVIPNAIVSAQFEPDLSRADPRYITIVVISRLVYRKGVDLLVASAPRICEMFPQVRFVVGGDGPKMVELEQMREKYLLQERVELVGAVRPSEVRDILTRGQIYLNTSLTEAFGISIIEAASAGLFVVSTKVGGVPEILPRDMIEFARADEEDVILALEVAIRSVIASEKGGDAGKDQWTRHERVKKMYSWGQVAERTEKVYGMVMEKSERDVGERLTRSVSLRLIKHIPLIPLRTLGLASELMSRLVSLGPLFGPIMCIIIAVQHYFFWALEWWSPRDEIDEVEDEWEHDNFRKVRQIVESYRNGVAERQAVQQEKANSLG